MTIPEFIYFPFTTVGLRSTYIYIRNSRFIYTSFIISKFNDRGTRVCVCNIFVPVAVTFLVIEGKRTKRNGHVPSRNFQFRGHVQSSFLFPGVESSFWIFSERKFIRVYRAISIFWKLAHDRFRGERRVYLSEFGFPSPYFLHPLASTLTYDLFFNENHPVPWPVAQATGLPTHPLLPVRPALGMDLGSVRFCLAWSRFTLQTINLLA